MTAIQTPGVLLIISAPLGVGKTTLCEAILDRHANAGLSVSCTTRPPGPRDVEGHDYFFLKPEAFMDRVNRGDFLEWVLIQGHYYGTPKNPLLDEVAAGQDRILNVDSQGAQSVKKAYPEAVTVFVCPSGWGSLVDRFKSQGADNGARLAGRLAAAREDVACASGYDYVVVGDDMIGTAENISLILKAERHRARRAEGHLRGLLAAAPPPAP